MKASDLVNKMVDDANSPFNDNPKDMPKGFNTRVEKLSPNQYVGFVANMLNTSPDKLIEHRRQHTDKTSIDDLKKLMSSGQKIDQPWLILNGNDGHVPHFQEGLHRMIAYGDLYGFDNPVGITIGTDDRDDYQDIAKMNHKQFGEYRKQVADRYKKSQEAKELEQKQKEIKDVAEWYSVDPSKVTPELIKKYYKELDDEFMI